MLFCLLFLASHAQMGYGHVDFEDTATLYRIDIDSTLHGNLWQIGHPQKTLFTASYNPPNAIVTDTLNPVPANSTSVFYYRTSGDFNTDSHDTGLYFWYMLDGDTLSDYGTIEFSVDYGATWRNVVKPDPYYGYPWWVLYDSTGNVLKSSYNSSDTIVFTGTTNGWYQFTIMDWLEMTVYDSIIFRFTYYTSATAAPHDGWMIDDIWFNTMWESVPERGQSFIAYPNPAADRLTITPG